MAQYPPFAKNAWLHACINTNGGSSKFWMVRQDGGDCIVCYGRLGTRGSEKRITRTFASDLFYKKLSAGYAEMTVKDILKEYYDVDVAQNAASQPIPAKPSTRRQPRMKAIPQTGHSDFNW